MKGYIYLTFSIIFEVFGSSMLKYSEGFTKLIPSVLLIVAYTISFAFFVFALKTISLSVGYSIWSGIGTAVTGVIGVVLFNEKLSFINMMGLFIIILGVFIMNSNKREEKVKSMHSI